MDTNFNSQDPRFLEAIKIANESNAVSAAALQRKLRISYNRAVSFIEQMHSSGLISNSEAVNINLFAVAQSNAGQLSPVHQSLALVAVIGEVAARFALPAGVLGSGTDLCLSIGKAAMIAMTTATVLDGDSAALYMPSGFNDKESVCPEDLLVDIVVHAADIAAELTDSGCVSWDVQQILNKLLAILVCLNFDVSLSKCCELYLADLSESEQISSDAVSS